MNTSSASVSFIELKLIKPIYLLLLFVMGLTGFAQMPIFKRYYIADIPGLGWLAQFYVTHTIHYIGAILLLFVMVYCSVLYLGAIKKRFDLTGSAYVKITLLTAISVTGVFRVLKNLPDVVFSPGVTMFIDISHLGFMMIFMLVGIIGIIKKSRWLKEAR